MSSSLSAKPDTVKKAKLPLLSRSLTPLVILGTGGMLASAAVVAVAGGIAYVWPAFLLLVLGPLLFPLLLLPAGLMAGLWHIMQANRKWFVRVFAAGSIAYIAALLSFTVAFMAWQATRMPAMASQSFVWMFVITAGVAPWAVFCLRDRGNQLVIMMLWMQVAAALLLLPLLVVGMLGVSGYGFSVWGLIIVMLLVQNLREKSQIASAAPPAEAEAETAPPANPPV